MKVYLIKFKTPRGIELEKKFIKTIYGFKPIFIEDSILGKENTILEQKEIEL
jgi:hypothetical protein